MDSFNFSNHVSGARVGCEMALEQRELVVIKIFIPLAGKRGQFDKPEHHSIVRHWRIAIQVIFSNFPEPSEGKMAETLGVSYFHATCSTNPSSLFFGLLTREDTRCAIVNPSS